MTSAKTGPQRSAVVSMMMAFGLLVAISWTARAASPLLLVVSKGDNALVVVDPDSGKILGKATAGEGPHEVEASADGKRAFVSNYGTGRTFHCTLGHDAAALNVPMVQLLFQHACAWAAGLDPGGKPNQ